jgi:hypothetical protein
MEILIHGDKLDFILEKERNILEILDSIERWLGENNKVIDELKIDGKLIHSTERKELEGHLISDTEKLEITTSNNEEYVINILMDTKGYIDRLLSKLSKGNGVRYDSKQKDDIFEGLAWLKDIFVNSCRVIGIDTNTIFYKALPLADIITSNSIILNDLEVHKHDLKVFSEIINSKLIPNIKKLDKFIPKVLQRGLLHLSKDDNFDIVNIDNCLEDVGDTIDEFTPIIKNIGTNLQADREVEAYIEIKNVLGLMDSINYHLRKLKELFNVKYDNVKVDDKTVDQISEEFYSLLNELSDALKSGDIVLIGDLFEYELIDKLEIYKRIFKELFAVIKKKSYN